MSATTPSRRVTVAVDLLGGDAAPAAVADAVALVLGEQEAVDPLLVGPAELADELLGARGLQGRVRVVSADREITADQPPARAVRAGDGSSVHVAMSLVRDGEAEAVVSVGSTGAVLAASVLTLGRVSGVFRPAVAVVLPAAHGPVVLLDAGGSVAATAEMLAQFAVAGSAYASTALGVARPRVGLLTVGSEPEKGDPLRREAASLIGNLPLELVGNVEGGEVCSGARADVVVTDGFTGNVLLKGVESAVGLVRGRISAEGAGLPGIDEVAERSLAGLLPEHHEGAMVLGVDGVVVVGHGASGPQAIAGCVALAARAARHRLVPRLGEAMEAFRPQDRPGGGTGVSA